MILLVTKNLKSLPSGVLALVSLFIVLTGTWLAMPLFTGQPQFKDISPNLQNAAPFIPDLGAPDLHAPNADNPGTPLQDTSSNQLPNQNTDSFPLQPSWDYDTLPMLPNQPFESPKQNKETPPKTAIPKVAPTEQTPSPASPAPQTPAKPNGVEIFPGITLAPQPPPTSVPGR